MIKNYLLIVFRSFSRNKNYTLINVLGLSIGITSCLIIFLLTNYELSFDKFQSRYAQLYRVVLDAKTTTGTEYGTATPYPFIKAFRNDFGDVPLATQLHSQDDMLVKIGAEKIHVGNVLFADSLFFEVFDFDVISGNPRVDLGRPGKVFLTKSLAEKILKGNETAHIKIDNKIDAEVAGIIADPPANSHIRFSMIVSMPSMTGEFFGFPLDRWGLVGSAYSYIVLPDKIKPETINQRLKDFGNKYLSEDDRPRKSFKLQALAGLHFDELYVDNPGPANANKSELIVMGIIGLFILSIACINFINLATAQAIKKSKEIGIRKTLGAKRSQLSLYFLGETFLLTLFSIVISLCAVEWLIRWLNVFLDVKLELNLLSNPVLVFFLLVLLIFTTILAGFYPAVVLAGFNPLVVLKNKISAQGTSGSGVRKVLVVFQFMIAQLLIMGTLIISDQMSYFKRKPLGFNKDAIVNVAIPENKKELLESFRTKLESNPAIQSLSYSLGAPTSESNFTTGYYLTAKGLQERYTVSVKPVDRFYLETYGLTLKAGRWFTENDEKEARMPVTPEKIRFTYIVNEAAARQLGFANPEDIIGTNITSGFYDVNAEVVGVVADFHTASLHEAIGPVILMYLPAYYYNAGMKLNPENLSETISFVEKQWNQFFPEYNFEYQFLDDHLASLYERDTRTFTLFKIFAAISIFIGCLGLYGLISFMAAQKLKEVGIRKVLGASVASIMVLFSREFVKLILIAFLVASPIAWYLMQQWLAGFAYRIPVSWTVFAIGLFSTLMIAILTVSYRSAQAAVTNPAETLRTE